MGGSVWYEVCFLGYQERIGYEGWYGIREDEVGAWIMRVRLWMVEGMGEEWK